MTTTEQQPTKRGPGRPRKSEATAKPEHPAPEGHAYERTIEVDMTHEESVAMSVEVAKLKNEIAALKNTKKLESKRLGFEIENLEAERDELIERNGRQKKLVTTRVFNRYMPLLGDKGIVEFVSVQTGEVVGSRPMKESDRQTALFVSPPAAIGEIESFDEDDEASRYQ